MPISLAFLRAFNIFRRMPMNSFSNHLITCCCQQISVLMWRIVLVSRSNSAVCLTPHGIVPLIWLNTSPNVAANMISTLAAVQPSARHRSAFWSSMKSMHWPWHWTLKSNYRKRLTVCTKDTHTPITNHATMLRYIWIEYHSNNLWGKWIIDPICKWFFFSTDRSLFGREIHWRSSHNHSQNLWLHERFETIARRIGWLIAFIVLVRWIPSKTISSQHQMNEFTYFFSIVLQKKELLCILIIFLIFCWFQSTI